MKFKRFFVNTFKINFIFSFFITIVSCLDQNPRVGPFLQSNATELKYEKNLTTFDILEPGSLIKPTQDYQNNNLINVDEQFYIFKDLNQLYLRDNLDPTYNLKIELGYSFLIDTVVSDDYTEDKIEDELEDNTYKINKVYKNENLLYFIGSSSKKNEIIYSSFNVETLLSNPIKKINTDNISNATNNLNDFIFNRNVKYEYSKKENILFI
jgi:hypothetical protein